MSIEIAKYLGATMGIVVADEQPSGVQKSDCIGDYLAAQLGVTLDRVPTSDIQEAIHKHAVIAAALTDSAADREWIRNTYKGEDAK